MERMNYERKLKGKYLDAYDYIKIICKNLTFFMNDDEYFEIAICEDSLDLLLEAQGHNQPVDYVLGKDLQKNIYLRCKEYSQYSFSFTNMAIVFIFLLMLFNYMFPNAFSFHYMEIEYYVLLLLPILSKFLFLFNQHVCIKMFFQFKSKTRLLIAYVLCFIECVIVFGLGVYILYLINAKMVVYNALLIILGMYLLYFKRRNKEISLIESINDYVKTRIVHYLFMVELILVIIVFAYLSRFIPVLDTTGSFSWFIPTLLMVLLSTIPLKGLKKSNIKNNEENILDQYLSYFQFLKTKREFMKDIPITQEVFFTKLQKKHQIYKCLSPFVFIALVICFGIFMTSFQLSVFYIIIIGYMGYALYNFYKYLLIVSKIDNVCKKGKQS